MAALTDGMNTADTRAATAAAEHALAWLAEGAYVVDAVAEERFAAQVQDTFGDFYGDVDGECGCG
jgi:hypothetical protein